MNTSFECSTSPVPFSHDCIRQSSHGFHISGRNKSIREIDLSLVFGNITLLSSSMNKDVSTNSQSNDEIQGMLALITSLDLSRNEIGHLNNLYTLCSLCKLDASYNLISRISGLPCTLTYLNLSHNKLCSLDGVSLLLHLRELDVSSNRLSNFMGLSSRLPLQTLRADDNRIVSTLGLEKMPHLRLLSMSNNFVENISELLFLHQAVSLQSLILKNNPIAQLTGYRQLVAQQQVKLLTLDGEPILHYPDRIGTVGHKEVPEAEIAPLLASTEIFEKEGATRRDKINGITPENAGFEAQDTKFDNLLANNSSFQCDGSRDVGRSVITPGRQGLPKSFMKHTILENLESPGPVASSHPPVPILINSKPTFSEDSNESHLMQVEAKSHSTAQIHTSPINSYTKQFLATRAPQLCSTHQTISASITGSLPSHRKSFAMGKLKPKSRSLLPRQHQRDPRDDETEECSSVSKRSPHLSLISSSMQQEDPVLNHTTVALLHDSLVTQEQLKRENQTLRAKLKNIEEQLSESRRVISEQLSKLSDSRVTINALRNAECDLKEQLERSKRHAKMMENHHKDEIKTLQTQYERTKVFYEAHIGDLKQQLAAGLNRSGCHTTSDSNDKHQMDSSLPHSPPDLITSAALGCKNSLTSELPSDEPRGGLEEQNLENTVTNVKKCSSTVKCTPLDSSTSAISLAEQLKAWLFHELAESASKKKVNTIDNKLLNSLDIENERSEGDEQEGRVESNFVLDAQAILEAIVLSKQYTIQNQPDSDLLGTGDSTSRLSQTSPR